MTNSRLRKEWPLAAFTLALQVACGIAIATTIAAVQLPTQSTAMRSFAMCVFPVVAAGLLLSLAHLGRPFSAWRALSNIRRSRLSREVLLSAAFAASAFVYSFASWTCATALLFPAGAITSVLGLSGVCSSAAIYRVPARPIWNAGWIMASFLGGTAMVTGLTLSIVLPSQMAITAVLLGGMLLLFSGLKMWLEFSQLPYYRGELGSWFAASLLLIATAPLLTIIFPENGLPLAGCTILLGIFTNRMLMFAAAELEPPF